MLCETKAKFSRDEKSDAQRRKFAAVLGVT